MAVTIKWKDNSSLEKGHRIYKSSTYFTPDNLPASLVDLSPDIEEYEDTTANAGENWYIVSAYILGYEVFSEPFIPISNTISIHDIFDDGSIIATYNFDGDATDLGGNYDGTLETDITFDTGISNQSVVTSGTDTGRVTGLFNNSTQNSAYSVWIATNSAFTYGTMAFNTFIIDNNENIEVFDSSNGTGNTTTYSSTSLSSYPKDNTFFHFVVSFSSNVPTVYINGVDVEVSQSSTGNRTSKLGGDTSTGGFLGDLIDNTGDSYYAARYDQLRIFNRPLTQEEVKTLYQEGLVS